MKGSKKHTVLLVDDSATNNLLLQVVFDQNGFNVETASSGKDAIKILAKKHIVTESNIQLLHQLSIVKIFQWDTIF